MSAGSACCRFSGRRVRAGLRSALPQAVARPRRRNGAGRRAGGRARAPGDVPPPAARTPAAPSGEARRSGLLGLPRRLRGPGDDRLRARPGRASRIRRDRVDVGAVRGGPHPGQGPAGAGRRTRGPFAARADADEQGHDRDAAERRATAASGGTLDSGPWDRQGRPSEVRLDRVIRVDPTRVRREGARARPATVRRGGGAAAPPPRLD